MLSNDSRRIFFNLEFYGACFVIPRAAPVSSVLSLSCCFRLAGAPKAATTLPELCETRDKGFCTFMVKRRLQSLPALGLPQFLCFQRCNLFFFILSPMSELMEDDCLSYSGLKLPAFQLHRGLEKCTNTFTTGGNCQQKQILNWFPNRMTKKVHSDHTQSLCFACGSRRMRLPCLCCINSQQLNSVRQCTKTASF